MNPLTHPATARSIAVVNAWEPIAAEDVAVCPPAGMTEAFSLRRAAADGQAPPTALVFASPHSGNHYPEDMMAASALDAQAIRPTCRSSILLPASTTSFI